MRKYALKVVCARFNSPRRETRLTGHPKTGRYDRPEKIYEPQTDKRDEISRKSVKNRIARSKKQKNHRERFRRSTRSGARVCVCASPNIKTDAVGVGVFIVYGRVYYVRVKYLRDQSGRINIRLLTETREKRGESRQTPERTS